MEGLAQEVDRLQERLDEVRKSQADIGVQMDSLGQDMNALRRQLEQNEKQMGNLSARLEDTHLALRNLAEQIAKGQKVEVPPEPSKIFREAYLDYTKNNYDLAILGFRQYLELLPKGVLAPDALYLLAECYRAKGLNAEALEHLEQLLKEFPDHERVWPARYQRAAFWWEEGRLKEAEEEWKKLAEAGREPEASLAKDQLERLASPIPPAVSASTASLPSTAPASSR